MPLNNYYCKSCGNRFTFLTQIKKNDETGEYEDNEPTVYCGHEDMWESQTEGCGSKDINRSLPRSFGITGCTTTENRYTDARGYFSASLGRYVESQREERKIMEANGFIPLSDLGGDQWWDDKVAKQTEKMKAQDELTKQYQTALQSGKSKEEAVAETFTAKDAVSGKLEKIYDTKITLDK